MRKEVRVRVSVLIVSVSVSVRVSVVPALAFASSIHGPLQHLRLALKML